MALVISRKTKTMLVGAVVVPLLTTMAVCQGSNALEEFVRQPDPTYRWELKEQKAGKGILYSRLELISQHWRESAWRHEILIARPANLRNPDVALVLIGGSGKGEEQARLLKVLAERAGAVAVVVTDVPNQPLYDGRVEDQLIAYSFVQYLKTQDESWPLLFPMVKSAVRAMDAVQDYSSREYKQKITRFVVGGASKRGWTTWLTAAVDKRVAGMAPMIFDMLNMRAQTIWARKVYGRQSEKIHDYTEANLATRLDEPELEKLCDWVDPYTYRNRYKIPTLIVLGTNDPYWTVDSLRHYWADLPGPKLLHQTPNAGHSWDGGASTLAAFFQMVADGQALPKLDWKIQNGPEHANLRVQANQTLKSARLWTADCATRDFRRAHWASTPLQTKAGSNDIFLSINAPSSGYRAYLVEAELLSPTGQPYKLCTEARVTPDEIK